MPPPTACDPQPATLILQLSTQAHSSAFCSAFGLPWEALNTSEIIIVKLSGFLGAKGSQIRRTTELSPSLHPQPQDLLLLYPASSSLAAVRVLYRGGLSSTFTDEKREVVLMGASCQAGLMLYGSQNYLQPLAQHWHIAGS